MLVSSPEFGRRILKRKAVESTQTPDRLKSIKAIINENFKICLSRVVFADIIIVKCIPMY